MGIDGIGSKGPPAAPPAGELQGAARPTEAVRAFEVNRAAPSAETVPASGPLDRLRAGEIDVHGYVEAKVQEATAQLGVLPLDQLESIRAALRQRMASDPTLADLLRTVAGGAGAALPVPPSPPSDD